MAILTRPTSAKQRTAEYLHSYYPTYSRNFGRESRRILDFKDGLWSAFQFYAEALQDRICTTAVLAVVPPHAPGRSSSVALLAHRLACKHRRVDASACLRRHRRIAKLAAGGDRSMQVHFNSVSVENQHLICGRRITLLDDVTTTGNSLSACRQLLLDAGALSVRCFALAKTTR